MTAPAVHFSNGAMSLHFTSFDMASYATFLKCKRLPEYSMHFDSESETYYIAAPARFAPILGLEDTSAESEGLPLARHLFDYQAHIVRTALEARRYAIWADCGLGKTAMFLEFARQVVARTAGRVLIFSPLQIIQQTQEEATKFYGEGLKVTYLNSRDDVAKWCVEPGPGIAISNYEKMIPGVMHELMYLAGVVLDESSILKTGGGVIKWNVIKSCRGIPYKLSNTATPAPNDFMEYASQAAFLEKLRNEGEILWTYFVRDKHGNWKIKPHGLDAFYRFMSSWSIYLRNPAAYGWTDNLQGVPPPEILEYEIPATPEQLEQSIQLQRAYGGDLFGLEKLGVSARTKLNQLAKGFVYVDKKPQHVPSLKPQRVAEIVQQDASAGLQVLVWTIYDEESHILAALLSEMGVEAQVLSGSTKPAVRGMMIETFRRGGTQVLISKASLLGYGMNFQNCGSMVFSGWDDSYERWYQAIRRAYRYGQTLALRVHVPFVRELEGKILENVLSKKARFEEETAIQERNYLTALKGMSIV